MSPTNLRTIIAAHVFVLAGALVLLFATAGSMVAGALCVLMLGASGTLLSVLFVSRTRGRSVEHLRRAVARIDDAPLHPALASEELLVAELGDRVDRMRGEHQHMEAERERLAAILSSMTEGVIAIDAEENILLANQASHAAMEGEPATAISRPLREFVRSVQVHDLVRAALKLERPDPIECELPRSNRIVTVRADIIGGDPPKGAVLTLHDISELRRLERIRREFVANVSHELKTPLTAIQACADTLADGAIDDPEPARRFVKRIDEQCGRLAEMIGDMLELARIESGREVLEISRIDPARLLSDLAREHENVAETNGLSIAVEIQTEPFTIESDLTSLRTLVTNLVDNAIKYTPAGGSVRLELDRDDEVAEIRVRDSGIGIDRAHIKRIFQRFYRVDSARSRESGGSGLGLAIVKHLAQQLAGAVEVESEPGVGTTFSLRLPIGAPDAVRVP